MRVSLCMLTVSLGILQNPYPAHSQWVISGGPECHRCEIKPTSEIRLGLGEEGAIPFLLIDIAEDSRGRYWVTFPYRELPRVFDRDGRVLRTLGAEGQGPGEFIGPVGIVKIPGDSMLVLDAINQRGSVVSADFTISRSIGGIPPLADLEVVSWPDSVLGIGIIHTPSAAGFPLHLVDLGGVRAVVYRSFGHGGGEFRPSQQYRLLRKITPVEDGQFVEAKVLEYSFSIRTVREEGLEIQRRPDWFNTPSEWNYGYYDTPPPPMVNGVSIGPRGIIWVFLRRRVEEWAAAWPEGLPQDGHFPARYLPPLDLLWRTHIDLFSGDGRRLISSGSIDGYVSSVLPGARAMVFRSADDGSPDVRIVTFQMDGGDDT